MLNTPSPDEFRAFLVAHGLTGAQAGALVGIQGRQIRRYTGGEVAVPYSVWFTLKMKLEQVAV